MTTLTFHGAAETVTGSRLLLQVPDAELLVDCGLFQGLKELRARNWKRPGFDPERLRAVILTHAHIDHSGYLPRLVREGFRGPIYCTPATADLAELLLRDSARIQEEDARYANRKGFSTHHPALPLYTEEEAEKAVDLFEVVDYGGWQRASPSTQFRFRHAGHLLGSAIVETTVETGAKRVRILFSGDVGRYDAPLVPDPAVPDPCDVLVVESTYGDRRHSAEPIEQQLRQILQKAISSRGTVLIPAFAVGRAQQLLYLLRQVIERERSLAVPIHLDSPMAFNVVRIYRRYPEEHGLDRSDRLQDALHGLGVFMHRTPEESKQLNSMDGPRVIISSSGMMTGGRVLHHLARLLVDSKNTIVLAGFQAQGTRGWRLKNGEKTLRIHGRDVPVRAGLWEISGLSGHADADQLVRWLRELAPPRLTLINHGDGEAPSALAHRLEQELGFRCSIPRHEQAFQLD
jgi:metallo-beta-lactamase family protein